MYVGGTVWLGADEGGILNWKEFNRLPDRQKRNWRKIKDLHTESAVNNGIVCKSKISTKYMLITI